MKKFFSKDICLWLVSPQDGTVRKIRLTSGKILLITALSIFFIGSFVFVAGDYTRVQVLRAKHYFNFKRLNNERGSLVSHNQDLRSRVQSLTQEKKRVLSYESEVRQRLLELSSVLKSAAEIGVIPLEDVTGSSNALGGAEADCDPESGNCQIESSPGYKPSSFATTVESTGAAGLISELERSIRLTRMLPIGLPGHGFISSNFGPRRSPFSGKLSKHQGVDFALPHGSSVYATGDGVVKSVRRTSTYGLKIDITHGSKIITRYAHLSKILVSEGQKVCRGQEIGLVGSTGRSTGPHLHYEVRVQGHAVDPQLLFDISEKVQGILL